ncbi:uncharacterized protein [Amphiura filiformis]|uniref:uncharacterized protein n=1 Tax=Amphiura filiformis TaxID=82378 RepID=UPI003B227C32
MEGYRDLLAEACSQGIVEYSPEIYDHDDDDRSFHDMHDKLTTTGSTCIDVDELFGVNVVNTSQVDEQLKLSFIQPKRWCPSETEHLLTAVAANPAIYNPGIPQYKDSLYKNNSWINIAEALHRPASDIELLQRKYKNLKDTYRRLKKEKLKGEPSGSGASSNKKEWEHFSQCDGFLAKFVKGAKTVSNTSVLVHEEETVVSKLSCVTQEKMPPPPPPPAKRAKKTSDEFESTVLKMLQQNTPASSPDASDHFGNFVASSLREMRPEVRVRAQAQIHNVLMEHMGFISEI